MKNGSCTSAVAIALTLGVGGWAWGGIEGSKHDFSGRPWANGETCGVCHTPHQSLPPKAAPLWNTKADLSRRFGTTALASTSKARPSPGGGTQLCLRCHDGTVVAPSIANVKRDRFVNKHNPGIFRSAHGGTDHPVGIAYPQVNKKFRPMTSVVALGAVVLPKGRVECISCHDPHNTSGVAKMLVTSNARSALCLTCHDK